MLKKIGRQLEQGFVIVSYKRCMAGSDSGRLLS